MLKKRNDEGLDTYNKLHSGKSYVKEEFWPEAPGEFVFVVANQGQQKVKADVIITVFEEIDGDD